MDNQELFDSLPDDDTQALFDAAPDESVATPETPPAPAPAEPQELGLRGVLDFVGDTLNPGGLRKQATEQAAIPGDPGGTGKGLTERADVVQRFREENPKISGVGDALGIATSLLTTGGFGGGAVKGAVGRIPAVAKAGRAGQALAGAAGGATTGALLGGARSGSLEGAGRGAAFGAGFGGAGAVAPALTMAGGAGLTLKDIFSSDTTTEERAAAITDLLLDLGGAGVGAAQARKQSLTNKVQPKLDDARVLATEDLNRTVANKDLDLQKADNKILKTQTALEATQEAYKRIPGATDESTRAFISKMEQLKSALQKKQSDVARSDEATNSAIARWMSDEVAKATRGEKTLADLDADIRLLTQRVNEENQSRAAKTAERTLRTEGREALASEVPESKSIRLKATQDIGALEEQLAQRRLDAANEAGTAGVPSVENHPRLVAAQEKLRLAQEAASPEALDFRGAQKGRSLDAERLQRINDLQQYLQDPSLTPEARAGVQAQLDAEAATIAKARLSNAATAGRSLRDLISQETKDAEVGDYRSRIQSEAEGNVRVAEANVERVAADLRERLEARAAKNPSDPLVQEIKVLRAKAKQDEARAREQEAQNPMSARRVDPVAAVSAARAQELLRAMGLPAGEVSDGATARDVLRSLVTPDVPSASQRRLSSLQDRRARLASGEGEALPPGRFEEIVQRGAQQFNLPPETFQTLAAQGVLGPSAQRLMATQHRAAEAAGAPLVDRTTPWDEAYMADPEYASEARRIADETGVAFDAVTPDSFRPGGQVPTRQRPVATLPDEDGRQFFRPGEDLPADQARLSNVAKQEGLKLDIEGQRLDRETVQRARDEAQSALDDLFGKNEAGRRRLQQIEDGSNITLTLGGLFDAVKTKVSQGDFRSTVSRLVAKDPLAASYFYAQILDNLRVSPEAKARYQAFVDAQNIKSSERVQRIIYTLQEITDEEKAP